MHRRCCFILKVTYYFGVVGDCHFRSYIVHFSVYMTPKKQHLINTRLLNGPLCPLFPFLLQWGDTDATSASFLEFHPKLFFPSFRLQGEEQSFTHFLFHLGLKFRAICPACHHRLGGSRRSRWSPVWRLFSSPTAWSSGWVGLPPNGGNNKLKEQQWAKKKRLANLIFQSPGAGLKSGNTVGCKFAGLVWSQRTTCWRLWPDECFCSEDPLRAVCGADRLNTTHFTG